MIKSTVTPPGSQKFGAPPSSLLKRSGTFSSSSDFDSLLALGGSGGAGGGFATSTANEDFIVISEFSGERPALSDARGNC